MLALGSNLAQRTAYLDLALQVFAEEGVPVLASTPRWNTVPIGTLPQPDFLNQLLLVEGSRSGRGWLELAHLAEERSGRRRLLAKGPRTLDVDVILIEGEQWDSPELTVPHPGLLLRPYLLRGARLLVPDWRHAGEGLSIRDLAERHLNGIWAGR